LGEGGMSAPSDLETRKFALELAVRIVLVGTWGGAGDRANAALALSDQFVAHLDPPPVPLTQAIAKRAVA
jgi:hypothetical protein